MEKDAIRILTNNACGNDVCENMTDRIPIEAALHESEERFRSLADSAPVLIWLAGLDKLCYWFNVTWLTFTGRTLEQEQGNGWAEGVHPDDLDRCIETYVTCFDNRQSFTMEYRLRRNDGSYRWILDSGSPTFVDGTFSGYIGSCTDVTDVKNAEANLSEQEQFYKATLDGIRAHICVINTHGTIITTNHAWETFGSENDAIKELSSIGANYFFACQSPAAEQDPFANEFTVGIRAVLDGTSPQFMKEYPCHTPEKDLWFICTASPFSINGVRYAVVSHEDIAWRKATESKLRMLSRVVDQSPVTVVVTDTEGQIEFVNPTFTEMCGYSAEEVIGLNPRVLKSGFTPPETIEKLWSTIKSGGAWEGEFINRSKNGDINFEAAKVSPIRNEEGVITNFVSIKENINKRKELESSLIKEKEKAEIANRAKDEFLAVMSHEMRTPLNGVIGMTDLLLDSELTDEQRDFVQVAGNCGDTLLGIISNILDFTLVRVNKLELKNQVFNLQTLLDETVSKFLPLATAAGSGLSCRIAPSTPRLLKGDAGKVQQIITGLLDNAIKFTAKGTIAVSVSCQSVEEGAAIIRFEVKDTGIGIAESRIKEVFSAFLQVDSSSTRCHGGTGMGLALARELAELLGGAIGVSSEVGKGSTFWFTARLELARQESGGNANLSGSEAASPVNMETAGQPEAAPDDTGPRILLAEDNAINQKIIFNLLKNLGYQADVVADGVKAVRALEIFNYDLVLMDCMMPEMNGYEATGVIRDRSSSVINHNVPIIAVTANALDGDREKCLYAGMDDYLAKPLNKKALADMLAKWFALIN